MESEENYMESEDRVVTPLFITPVSPTEINANRSSIVPYFEGFNSDHTLDINNFQKRINNYNVILTKNQSKLKDTEDNIERIKTEISKLNDEIDACNQNNTENKEDCIKKEVLLQNKKKELTKNEKVQGAILDEIRGEKIMISHLETEMMKLKTPELYPYPKKPAIPVFTSLSQRLDAHSSPAKTATHVYNDISREVSTTPNYPHLVDNQVKYLRFNHKPVRQVVQKPHEKNPNENTPNENTPNEKKPHEKNPNENTPNEKNQMKKKSNRKKPIKKKPTKNKTTGKKQNGEKMTKKKPTIKKINEENKMRNKTNRNKDKKPPK